MNNTGHTFYYAMAKIDKEILTAKQKARNYPISVLNEGRTEQSTSIICRKAAS
jgi:hypothetical protein